MGHPESCGENLWGQVNNGFPCLCERTDRQIYTEVKIIADYFAKVYNAILLFEKWVKNDDF